MPFIQINNFTASRTVDYRTTITFSASVQNPTASGQIHWFVNDREVAVGDSYTVSEAKATFRVQVKYVDGDTVLAQSEIETVNVNTGFFARLIAFFRCLFGNCPKVVQEYLGVEFIDRDRP
jgi:hypothetical protein